MSSNKLFINTLSVIFYAITYHRHPLLKQYLKVNPKLRWVLIELWINKSLLYRRQIYDWVPRQCLTVVERR